MAMRFIVVFCDVVDLPLIHQSKLRRGFGWVVATGVVAADLGDADLVCGRVI